MTHWELQQTIGRETCPNITDHRCHDLPPHTHTHTHTHTHKRIKSPTPLQWSSKADTHTQNPKELQTHMQINRYPKRSVFRQKLQTKTRVTVINWWRKMWWTTEGIALLLLLLLQGKSTDRLRRRSVVCVEVLREQGCKQMQRQMAQTCGGEKRD